MLRMLGLQINLVGNTPENTSADGRYIDMPKNVILEIKFLDTDIKGTIT